MWCTLVVRYFVRSWSTYLRMTSINNFFITPAEYNSLFFVGKHQTGTLKLSIQLREKDELCVLLIKQSRLCKWQKGLVEVKEWWSVKRWKIVLTWARSKRFQIMSLSNFVTSWRKILHVMWQQCKWSFQCAVNVPGTQHPYLCIFVRDCSISRGRIEPLSNRLGCICAPHWAYTVKSEFGKDHVGSRNALWLQTYGHWD